MIVGIVGLMGSGKGTVGDILEYSYGFKKESFAKPLKDATASMFGWDRQMLEGDHEYSREWREKVDPYWSQVLDRPNFTPRLAMQLLGTEAGRDVFGKDLWTASCIRRCGGSVYPRSDFGAKSVIENFVITDCRFRNEIEAIQKANGVLIKVDRNDSQLNPWFREAYDIGKESYDDLIIHMSEYNAKQTDPKKIHQSEWDWIGCSFGHYIHNNETIADLERKVYDIMFELKLTQKPFHLSRQSAYVPDDVTK